MQVEGAVSDLDFIPAFHFYIPSRVKIAGSSGFRALTVALVFAVSTPIRS